MNLRFTLRLLDPYPFILLKLARSFQVACGAATNVQSACRSKRLPRERRALRFVPAVRLPAGADQPAGKRLKPGERGC